MPTLSCLLFRNFVNFVVSYCLSPPPIFSFFLLLTESLTAGRLVYFSPVLCYDTTDRPGTPLDAYHRPFTNILPILLRDFDVARFACCFFLPCVTAVLS